MKKIIFSIILACWLANILGMTATMAQAAETSTRPLVIAVLLYTANNLKNLEGFKAGMQDRGYVEGRDVTYVFNGPTAKISELDAEMAHLMSRQPDLIYAAPTPAAWAARKATMTQKIPVVFGPVNDPVDAGLLKDRQHPGGNITGVMLADSDGKRLQWIKEFSQQAKTVLVPYNPDDTSSVLSLQDAREAAAVLGLDIQAKAVRNQDEISALIAQGADDGIDAIFLPRDAMVMVRVKDFIDLSLRQKAILSSARSDLVEGGALFSYGFIGFEVGKQVARLADLILQGKSAGDLPVETAEDFLTINLETANAIGLTIAPHILRQAHQIFRPH
jgi:putative ABC transport system substrate-binding protein